MIAIETFCWLMTGHRSGEKKGGINTARNKRCRKERQDNPPSVYAMVTKSG
ncbi:hypothetical protein EPIR_0014 [Erwinia piriflorinigrans CFBP 5888]|uniref:Uncharacterized protein n=1 Tax=Erwinia piriflorinigrans CFBP 5888 TaxID=1161919 RepID=V5Z2Z1_9GAMM|nr:hypothetical protein EPIR_0014 [Erwinia piriflorinigrans CFBP 5888]